MTDIASSLDDLARNLMLNARLIPLQRRIRASGAAIDALLALGITVRALAEELAARGVTDLKGAPLSYGHVRVLLSRRRANQRVGTPQTQELHPAPAARRSGDANRPDFSAGLFGSGEHVSRKT